MTYPSRREPSRDQIDANLARRLIAEQFPQFAHLEIRDVELSGWDNRTFRLGNEMSVRLPSAAGYVSQVEKEHRWLPYFAPRLPLPIPVSIAIGQPSAEYPWPWSINSWLPGEPAATAVVTNTSQFARDLADFLASLYRIDPIGGTPAGVDSFFRGCPPASYDDETRAVIALLAEEIDADAALSVWESAISSPWSGQGVWFHGDVAVGNLLVQRGRLSAVIDFGTAAVGDPACDTVIAWTFFTGESREAFAQALPVDSETWVRGRGWALWKCLITLRNARETDPAQATEQRRILNEILTSPLG